MYWGDYSGQHYSALTQITPNNARQLKTAWTFPILGGNSVLEATPIVVDGVMYTTGSGNPATVTAIDARTGRQIWRWTRQQKIVNPYEINPFARGVAILGNRIFVGTLDGALVAVDARTGQTLWEQQVVDTMEGSSITSPPLVLERHGHHRHDGWRVRDERVIWMRTMRRRANASGASTRSLRQANPGTTRGRVKAGKPEAARRG